MMLKLSVKIKTIVTTITAAAHRVMMKIMTEQTTLAVKMMIT